MGNELSTSIAQQDWSEEQVAAQLETEALFDFDGFLASLNPPPRAPGSYLRVDTETGPQTVYVDSTSSFGFPEDANRPNDGLSPPDEMSPTSCRRVCPTVPTQSPSVVAAISGGPASNMQDTSISVLLPMSPKIPPLDVSSPHCMSPSCRPAQAPTLPADAISSPTSVPGVVRELTPLRTETLARAGGSLVRHPLDGSKASNPPGFNTARPVHQPMPSVDQKHPNQRKYTPRPRMRPSMTKKLRKQPSIIRKSNAKRPKEASAVYGGGCRLDMIAKLGRHGACVPDYDTVAFPDQRFNQKASFRLHLEGHAPFHRQLNVLLGGRQPTKGRLAEVTARFVEYFIEHCEEQGRPFQYRLEDMVLRRIDLVSRSSIQPFFDFSTAMIG